jgi:hypothetical protein
LGDAVAQAGSGPSSTQQAYELGQGYDFTNEETTNDVCVGIGGVTVRTQRGMRADIFAVHSESDLKKKLNSSLDVTATVEGITGEIMADYRSKVNEQRDTDALLVSIQGPLIQRAITQSTSCSDARMQRNPNAFLQSCGDGYVDADQWIGSLTLIATGSRVKRVVKEAVDAGISLSIPELLDASSQTKFNKVLQKLTQSLNFELYNNGMPPIQGTIAGLGASDPQNCETGCVGNLSPQAVNSYLVNLTNEVQQAVANDDYQETSLFGQQLEVNPNRHVTLYQNTDIRECVDGEVSPEAMEVARACTGRTQPGINESLQMRLDNLRDTYNHMLDETVTDDEKPAEQVWLAPKQEHISEARELERDIQRCKAQIEQRRDACKDAQAQCADLGPDLSGNPSLVEQIQDACSLERSRPPSSTCALDNLRARINDVQSTLVTPSNKLESHVARKGASAESKENRICALTYVSGKFAGGGEEVRLTLLDDDEWQWKLSVSSARNDPAEEVKAKMTCAPKSLFPDDVDWKAPTETKAVAPGNGTEAVEDLGSKEYMAFISGLQGKFEGLGERVVIRDGDDRRNLVAHRGAASQRLHGWAYVTGPELSGDSDPLTASQSASEGDRTVIGASESGFCFLTSVKGNLDGAGENISLNGGGMLGQQWVLEVRSGNEGGIPFIDDGQPKNVVAEARCFPYTP